MKLLSSYLVAKRDQINSEELITTNKKKYAQTFHKWMLIM